MFYQNRILKRLIGALAIVSIFYFLGKRLILNWHQIENYNYSFNYYYLILSFLFFIIGNSFYGLFWKKMIDKLERSNNFTYFEAIKISLYSQLGKYIPGKVFGYLGQAYLSREKKISKKNLYFSIILDAFFLIIAAFFISTILISFFYLQNYLYSFLIILSLSILVLLVTHPKLFSFLIETFLKIFNKKNQGFNFVLNWPDRIKFLLGYSFALLLIGVGFFCLVNSIISFPFSRLFLLAGFYILASVLGLVAFFAPSGLGIREGILVLFLKDYLPVSTSILISVLARIWSILGDLIAVGIVFTIDLIKRHVK